MTEIKELFVDELDELEEGKKKKPYSSKTYTTGDIDYNINQFNKRMGTNFPGNDNNNPSTEEAKAQKAAEAAAKAAGTVSAASPDGGTSVSTSAGDAGEGGGMAEELVTESKRYVRRYYIRPQNIFCSNKMDIIKTLIDLGNQNCSVYTLNNLGDDKDVTKLTTDDIIYYYDKGILYDKNHVKVMDYDLYIKHEENRDSLNPNKVSDTKFKDVYDDRITDTTVVESKDVPVVDCPVNDVITHSEDEKPLDCKMEKKPLEKPLSEEAFCLDFPDVDVSGSPVEKIESKEKLTEILADRLGEFVQRTKSDFSNLVKDTQKELDQNNSKSADFATLSVFCSKLLDLGFEKWNDADALFNDGESRSPMPESVMKQFCIRLFNIKNLSPLEDLGIWDGFQYIQEFIDDPSEDDYKSFWADCEKYISDSGINNVDEVEESLKSSLSESKHKEICCICGEEIDGYGNNPEPYKSEGRCCDACNLHFVIPARLEQLTKEEN